MGHNLTCDLVRPFYLDTAGVAVEITKDFLLFAQMDFSKLRLKSKVFPFSKRVGRTKTSSAPFA